MAAGETPADPALRPDRSPASKRGVRLRQGGLGGAQHTRTRKGNHGAARAGFLIPRGECSRIPVPSSPRRKLLRTYPSGQARARHGERVQSPCLQRDLPEPKTMVFEHIEQLKHDWTDQLVLVDDSRPELARFAKKVGQVKTVNYNGKALVQFRDPALVAWFDIDVAFLRKISSEEAERIEAEAEAAKAAATRKAPPAKKGTEAKKPAAAPSGKKKMSTAEILAAARSGKAAAGAAAKKEEPAAEKPKPARKKMSTAEILAAARRQGAGQAAPAKPAAEEEQPAAEAAPAATSESPAVDAPKKPRSKMSVAEIIAAARKADSKKSAPEPEPAGGAAATEPEPATAEEPEAAAPSSGEAATGEEASPAGSEAPSAEPSGAEAPPAGELPKTTAEIIAYCRRVDAGRSDRLGG